MKLINLQTIAVIVVLSIFILWSVASIIDDMFLGNKGVTVPDQFWGLLGVVLGSLLYALKYYKPEKDKKEDEKPKYTPSDEVS